MIALAIEESAAEVLATLSEVPEELWQFAPTLLPDSGLRIAAAGDATFVLGPDAHATSSLTIFPITANGYFSGISNELRDTVLERCLRAALILRRPGQMLPRSWAPFRDQNFTIFYSTTIAMGNIGQSARSIVQKSPAGTPHVLVCAFIADGRALDLKSYIAPPEAEDALFESDSNLLKALDSIPLSAPGHDFKRLAAQALPSQGRGLSEWLPLLTPQQTNFLKSQLVGPTKIRGAAGTGKTLALMLKAIHELYQAQDNGRTWRGLILTHNWSSAESIRASLSAIDERRTLSKSDTMQNLQVMTLQSLATDALRLNSPDARPLSEDGHDGKMMQLEAIESLVQDLRTADWLLYRDGCSDHFRGRIEARQGTPEARLLAWDLMNEFACVISANRNTPRDVYIGQERRRWMMSLPKRTDREVVHLLHERFRLLMHDELNALTTYDVINDYLRWLDTNSWHLKRRKEGYDAILIDEFHLFNKQEVLVFHYLSRDPGVAPPAVLALDPRQSPSETFLGFKADKSHPSTRLFTGGEIAEVRFEEVFRYTTEINALLNVLEQCWFGFELEDEHDMLPRVSAATGAVPTLLRVSDTSRALDEALRLSREALTGSGRVTSVAVLCLRFETLEALGRRIRALGREKECRFVLSRDSSEALPSVGKRLVVSQPEYVAGSQFDAVVLVDADEAQVRSGADDHLQQRRVLSNLYLGISRARRIVRLIAADAEGGPLRFLNPALVGQQLQTERS